MNQTDLIILAVYLICVFYVMREAWESLEEQTMVKHVGNDFDYETLKEFVEVKFDFKDDQRFKFSDQPKKLVTTIDNKSPTATITIDWERGSLRNFQGGERRLVRLPPNLEELDLSKAQVPGTISPKRSLKVELTAENLLVPEPETKVLELKKPIVDVEQLSQDKNAKPKPGDKKDAAKIQKLKDTYNNFMGMREPLQFSLRLPIQITNYSEGSKKDLWGFVDSNFIVARTPRIEYIPWNPKPKRK